MSLPIGLCSRKRAEYLMMSAAVAGGAIYVDLPGIPGLTEDEYGFPAGLLCVGQLPSGAAVPTKLLDADTVLAALAAERDRLSKLAEKHSVLADRRDAVRDVYSDLIARLDAAPCSEPDCWACEQEAGES